MAEHFDLIIRGGRVVVSEGVIETDVGVVDGRIKTLGALGRADATRVLDAAGLHVLPGVIDTQVHFREPGMEGQDDIDTGSRGAVLGGVTSVFEMPNTIPSTIDKATFDDKMHRAAGRAFCDYAVAVGGAETNIDQLADLERLPGCCGVNLFLGSSTAAKALEGDEALLAILAKTQRVVSAHCEDETRLKQRRHLVDGGAPVSAHAEWRDAMAALTATRRFLAAARKTKRRVHVLNITTAEEMPELAANRDLVSADATPLHLTFATEDYARLGSLIQTNPPIRDARHRDALWVAINAGVIEVVASDHSPHAREEKAKPYPASPSGAAGVQTLVPVLLDHVAKGRIDLARFVAVTASGPARVYGVQGKGQIAPGFDADFTLVDLAARRTIEDSQMSCKVKWTPFAGMTVTGWPMATVIRGAVVMQDGDVLGKPTGQPLRFAALR